jgi:hypothetical protein
MSLLYVAYRIRDIPQRYLLIDSLFIFIRIYYRTASLNHVVFCSGRITLQMRYTKFVHEIHQVITLLSR